MSGENNVQYEFGTFRLDAQEKRFWQSGVPVNLSPKEFDTLVVLVKNRGHLIEKAELMAAVWGSTIVEEGNLNLIISNLRKILGDNPSNPQYIETVRKRGFRFIATVSPAPEETVGNSGEPTQESVDLEARTDTEGYERPLNQEDSQILEAAAKQRFPRKSFVIAGVVIALMISVLAIAVFRYNRANQSNRVEIHTPFEELEVKRVVKESQLYETLTIYTNPNSFDKSKLGQYWVPVELGGKEIKNVEASVDRLLKKGWRYEIASRAELFEFRYVKVFAPGDYAEVGTIERWYLPTCKQDGSRVPDKNVYLGPQAIDYRLKKINGLWLIDETTVPRPPGS